MKMCCKRFVAFTLDIVVIVIETISVQQGRRHYCDILLLCDWNACFIKCEQVSRI